MSAPVRRLVLLTVLATAALAAPAAAADLPRAAPAATADVPRAGALYTEGPDGRYLLDGPWLLRLDPGRVGRRAHWERGRSARGWSEVTVPNAWNRDDPTGATYLGGTAWYRKDFTLPSGDRAFDWILRFESVNNSARVWLNGRRLGSHRGPHVPFELSARDAVRRSGVNRLVVEVDSRRTARDFPPGGVKKSGGPIGGWWNYGGILREVYLRRVRAIDFEEVGVTPDVRCPTCPARVEVEARLRNVSSRSRRVRVGGRFGKQRLSLGAATIRPGGSAWLRRRITVPRPRLWSIERPSLYTVRLQATGTGAARAGYTALSGIRSVRVADGRLLLNGRALNVRGVGFHEDRPAHGMALDSADREWLVDQTLQLGGTMMRTHYPPHPQLVELADRRGVLIWSEVPVYSTRTRELAKRSVRDRAVALVRRNVQVNRNHPSIVTWSIANELSPNVGSVQARYIELAARAARAVDPSRPVSLAYQGYITTPCQRYYAPLDLLGINTYFGWYTGPGGQIFDRTRLGAYLDSQRRCYPRQALMVTEFGAEANRDGPSEEKGTWDFQSEWAAYSLGVFATKPWLSGALYWALNEFRIRPDWEGGNPRPGPPLHQKGLLRYDGTRKPAWAEVERRFRETVQIAPP